MMGAIEIEITLQQKTQKTASKNKILYSIYIYIYIYIDIVSSRSGSSIDSIQLAIHRSTRYYAKAHRDYDNTDQSSKKITTTFETNTNDIYI
jgi:hypothetical protein